MTSPIWVMGNTSPICNLFVKLRNFFTIIRHHRKTGLSGSKKSVDGVIQKPWIVLIIANQARQVGCSCIFYELVERVGSAHGDLK